MYHNVIYHSGNGISFRGVICSVTPNDIFKVHLL